MVTSGEPGQALKRRRAGRGHYVLRLARPLGPDDAGRLAGRGLRVLNRAAPDALVVSAGDGALLEGLELETPDAAAKISAAAAETDPAWVVEFHADIDSEEARAVVREAGLDTLEHPDLLERQMLVAGPWERVAALAGWDEVAYIFPAAHDLLLGIRVVACPGAMTDFGPAAQYTSMGRGWTGAGQGIAEIGYFFSNATAKLPRSTVESEMVRALEEWAKHGNLKFSPAGAAPDRRTITVLFARGAHGDGLSFDGPGKVLAHTYYPAPPNPEPLAGDMHLDADENWQVGSGIDLFTVALHEAGHALGLGHSDRPGSVMYPYYRQAGGLTADDIAGIRALYGTRETATGVRLSILDPAAAAVSTGAAAITVSGTAENAGTVAWRSDRGPSGAAQGVERWMVAAVPLSPGVNVISVTASGAAGDQATRSVTVTRQDAALAILQPPSPAVTTSAASVAISGTASNAVAVTWQSDRGPLGTAAGTARWTIAAVPLSAGVNVVSVTAADAAGAKVTRSVTVTRQSAGLAILEPASAAVTTQAASMAISGTAEGAAAVTWRSDRGPSGTAAGMARWTIAAVPLSAGANVITITATDAAGAKAARSLTVTRQEGGGAGALPALRITSPAFTIVSTSLAAITLRGTASSAGGIATVTWSNAAGGSGKAAGTTSWVAADIPLLKGTNNVTVRAYDEAGNSAWRALTVVRR